MTAVESEAMVPGSEAMVPGSEVLVPGMHRGYLYSVLILAMM